MRQLHCALEVSDLPGQHEPSAFDQSLLEELGVEEGCRNFRPSVGERYDEILTLRWPVRPLGLCLRNDVDERDVFAFLEVLTLAAHRHSVAVLARVVAQQVVDGADAEVLLERTRGLLA